MRNHVSNVMPVQKIDRRVDRYFAVNNFDLRSQLTCRRFVVCLKSAVGEGTNGV